MPTRKIAGRRYLAQIEGGGLRKEWLPAIHCNNAAPDEFGYLQSKHMKLFWAWTLPARWRNHALLVAIPPGVLTNPDTSSQAVA